ncbi:hypothetical protein VNI00_002363 [Paramarasmius palmivorus]|uniref:Uncharacterized protein n=1 Tax=Paramarasmius palmivorus TaxID=297713 RepID=A0AAW0DZW8_9AGAR
MGFFSSRKPDDDYVPDDKTTVVQVIRSRFYGRHKGKEHTERPNTTFVSQDGTAAQTLSHPSPIRHTASAPLLNAKKSSQNHDPNYRTLSGKLKSSVRKNILATEASSSSMAISSPSSPPSQSRDIELPQEPPQHTTDPKNATTASPRKQTDSATMTLAQRLNELAVANAEGLLNDDEYRMLRQNLFERFAGNAAVPTETPVVPASTRRHLRGPSEAASVSSRPSSNFIVDLPRTPSVRSKSSVRSGVASLFHRATGRRTASGSRDFSDTSSVFSATSGVSTKPQPIRKKSSSSSVHTEASRPADTMSITSRRTGQTSDRSPIDFNSSRPHTPIRPSNTSLRHMAAPPSSFPRTPVSERYTPSVRDVFDEANLVTSQDIKQEMTAVEAEKKRLLDAFNGLEVTTLAKRQRRPNTVSRPATIVVDSGERLQAAGEARPGSTITLIPDPRPSRLQPDSDVLSIHSGFSVSTNPSIHRKNLGSKNGGSLANSSSRGSLSRKGSSSSMSSAGRAAAARSKHVPPVPALPSYMGQLGHASSSSVNLTRSNGHLPLAALPENEISFISMVEEQDEDELEFAAEMDDIRRRREEVSQRYDARLDYLRAKLKGAQLHEKLMRK